MYLENAAVQVEVARALTKFYSSKGSSQTICIGRFQLTTFNRIARKMIESAVTKL